MPERIWHSISKLEFFIDHTRRWAVDVRENVATLEDARATPHVLADNDLARLRRVYGEQADDLTLFEEQAQAWGRLPDLSSSRRDKLQALNDQLAELRALNTRARDLAEELSASTIDTVMAASDEELGLAALVDERPGV